MQETCKRSSKRPITAVGLTVCGHSVVLGMINLFEGERWAYGFWVIENLRRQNWKMVAYLYDINCRWSGPAMERLRAKGLDAFPLHTPSPSFHVKAHDSYCQATNDPRHTDGYGTLRGEPTETTNALLGRWAPRTHYMSKRTRALLGTVVAQSLNDGKVRNLGRDQAKAYVRATQSMVSTGALSFF